MICVMIIYIIQLGYMLHKQNAIYKMLTDDTLNRGHLYIYSKLADVYL
jgi:hypothetical protein